ncbi:SDR family oxidoreductase [Streptomyces oceani]|uniref:Short-chain dehydrogenase n=1 Tax=Streptomyces oceani TaxID=1075402 RepID=A0A1E7KL04_9ACTN|nr:SDR family oxidoreductase [Streptomyces oceani]OEV04564.1 short-chain dehydrogenase [Streptomyces oceani]
MARQVVVSGAASGIGRELTGQLRARGDEVTGIDLRDAEVCADLGSPTGRREAVEEVARTTGGVVDAVVACAGVSGTTQGTVAVNYFGATELLRGLRPALMAASLPRAAVVGSISGTQPNSPDIIDACLAGDETAALAAAATVAERGEGRKLYPSSKAALARWLRSVCVTDEWAGAGIPLNAVAPGVVRTPMSAAHSLTPEQQKVMDEAVPMPLGGHSEAGTIAAALRWLISPENSQVTGQVLYVDGGAEATLRGPEVF